MDNDSSQDQEDVDVANKFGIQWSVAMEWESLELPTVVIGPIPYFFDGVNASLVNITEYIIN